MMLPSHSEVFKYALYLSVHCGLSSICRFIKPPMCTFVWIVIFSCSLFVRSCNVHVCTVCIVSLSGWLGRPSLPPAGPAQFGLAQSERGPHLRWW